MVQVEHEHQITQREKLLFQLLIIIRKLNLAEKSIKKGKNIKSNYWTQLREVERGKSGNNVKINHKTRNAMLDSVL